MLPAMTIFFIWLGGIIPEPYEKIYKTCIVEYENCIVIGEDQYRTLAAKYNFADHTNTVNVQRADLLKLLYMQEYGGIYLDFDIQVRDWTFLRQLNCTNLYFGEELWQLLYLKQFKPSNYFACSPKNNPKLGQVIKGITRSNDNPGNGDILNYAGPYYLMKHQVRFMILYPNIKHCYNSNWKQNQKNFNCYTPSWINGYKPQGP